MITKPITDQMIQQANDWCPSFIPDKHTVANPMIGNIGEIIFHGIHPEWQRISVNSTDCDFTWNGINVDVKTQSYHKPLFPKYNWRIQERQLDNHTDYYYFIHLTKQNQNETDPTSDWTYQVLGWIKKIDFINASTHYPTGHMGFIVPTMAVHHERLQDIQKRYNIS